LAPDDVDDDGTEKVMGSLASACLGPPIITILLGFDKKMVKIGVHLQKLTPLLLDHCAAIKVRQTNQPLPYTVTLHVHLLKSNGFWALES